MHIHNDSTSAKASFESFLAFFMFDLLKNINVYFVVSDKNHLYFL